MYPKSTDNLKVEHYERKAVRYYDQGPQGDTELRVTSANRTQDYVKKASAILESKNVVVVSGHGTVCSRVVTVAELMKKKYKKSGIKQECKIKYIKTEDVWEPTKEGLDPLRVVKRIPSITITMETPHPSPPSPPVTSVSS